ncbi:MAG: hypothetical protein KatS3mg105_0749 [Gemmatales bacterium]|nr:MAG: hypothetical protein KatS3mg105_0749 [Gemmatales bacterium]
MSDRERLDDFIAQSERAFEQMKKATVKAEAAVHFQVINGHLSRAIELAHELSQRKTLCWLVSRQCQIQGIYLSCRL